MDKDKLLKLLLVPIFMISVFMLTACGPSNEPDDPTPEDPNGPVEPGDPGGPGGPGDACEETFRLFTANWNEDADWDWTEVDGLPNFEDVNDFWNWFDSNQFWVWLDNASNNEYFEFWDWFWDNEYIINEVQGETAELEIFCWAEEGTWVWDWDAWEEIWVEHDEPIDRCSSGWLDIFAMQSTNPSDLVRASWANPSNVPANLNMDVWMGGANIIEIWISSGQELESPMESGTHRLNVVGSRGLSTYVDIQIVVVDGEPPWWLDGELPEMPQQDMSYHESESEQSPRWFDVAPSDREHRLMPRPSSSALEVLVGPLTACATELRLFSFEEHGTDPEDWDWSDWEAEPDWSAEEGREWLDSLTNEEYFEFWNWALGNQFTIAEIQGETVDLDVFNWGSSFSGWLEIFPSYSTDFFNTVRAVWNDPDSAPAGFYLWAGWEGADWIVIDFQGDTPPAEGTHRLNVIGPGGLSTYVNIRIVVHDEPLDANLPEISQIRPQAEYPFTRSRFSQFDRE